MYNNIGLQRYQEANIHSLTKEKMIVLLYEKIESDLEEVREAIAAGDTVRINQRVNHSQRIVCELNSALDHEVGGEISANLESLYDYMFHEHLEIIIDKDPCHIDNCLKVLRPLLDSWRRIPAGTSRQAEQDRARGVLHSSGDGPETAIGSDEETKVEAAPVENPLGLVAESRETISLSV